MAKQCQARLPRQQPLEIALALIKRLIQLQLTMERMDDISTPQTDSDD
jgi:hypothetical protein